jgi:hypothetical protein
MARGRKQTLELIVGLLRQIEVGTANRKTVPIACKEAGPAEQTYYLYGLVFFCKRRSSDGHKTVRVNVSVNKGEGVGRDNNILIVACSNALSQGFRSQGSSEASSTHFQLHALHQPSTRS